MVSAEIPTTKAENPNLPEQDQEGSTMDEFSKTSIPDTPSLTIKDPHFLEIR